MKMPKKWCVKVSSVNDYKQDAIKKGYDLNSAWIDTHEGENYYYYSEKSMEFVTPSFVSIHKSKNYEEITIEQFKQYLKPEKMKGFNITGSFNLLTAFIKDSGIAYFDDAGYNEEDYNAASYLCSTPHGTTVEFDSRQFPADDEEQFHLPEQYNEALEYVKKYFSSFDKPVRVAGYTAEIDGKKVKFGCQFVTKKELYALKEVMVLSTRYNNLLINSDSVTCCDDSERSLSLEQIDILLKKF